MESVHRKLVLTLVLQWDGKLVCGMISIPVECLPCSYLECFQSGVSRFYSAVNIIRLDPPAKALHMCDSNPS